MSNNENEPLVDDDDAAALFAQITSEDSAKDSDKQVNDELELDQEGDTDTDEDENEDDDQQGGEEDDPWKSAPETLRQQHEALQQANQKLQNDFQSVSNRLAPTQRELEKFRRQIADSETTKESKKPAEEAPTAEDLEGMSNAEIEEEYPELATFLKARDKQIQQNVEDKLSPLQKMQEEWEAGKEQSKQNDLVQSELTRVAQVHPDYKEIAANQDFHSWVAEQPQTVQRIAGSMDAEDNIYLLNLYKGQRQPAKSTPKSKVLSDHLSIPRKGGGKPQSDLDDSDPVELFNRITR
jgi:hypothetical protein